MYMYIICRVKRSTKGTREKTTLRRKQIHNILGNIQGFVTKPHECGSSKPVAQSSSNNQSCIDIPIRLLIDFTTRLSMPSERIREGLMRLYVTW